MLVLEGREEQKLPISHLEAPPGFHNPALAQQENLRSAIERGNHRGPFFERDIHPTSWRRTTGTPRAFLPIAIMFACLSSARTTRRNIYGRENSGMAPPASPSSEAAHPTPCCWSKPAAVLS